MAADFKAFTSSTVLENFQKKIDVLEIWDDSLLAGLVDGTLVVLRPNTEDPQGPWQVVQAYKNIAQKYIAQLQVWKEQSLLLCLNEEGVTGYRLPSFRIASQAGRTRGANRFALDEARAILCVAARKRLLLFHFDGKDFVELKELGLPDTVVSMAWCGDSICLGFKREYATINANTGALTELFPGGKPGNPCVTPVGAGELLLARDNVGIFLGPDGKVSRKLGLFWSDSPIAVGYSAPYAVALLTNYVECRSVQRVSQHGMAQLMPIPGMAVVTGTCGADGSLYVASGGEGGIRRLMPVPFDQQAELVADLDEFGEALALANMISDSQAAERTALTDRLHIRYGHYLFAHEEYEEAMAHFGMCSYANPLILLRLFPSLAPAHMLEPLADLAGDYRLEAVPEPRGEDFTKAVAVLLPYLLSHRSRLASLELGGPEDEGEGPSADGTSAGEATETQALTTADTSRAFAELQALTPQQRTQLAAVIDTAVLKAMLEMHDTGALLRFVQRPNHVDLEEGEAALRSKGRYSELVALYGRRGQHEAALDLLYKLSQCPKELPVAPQGASAELEGLTGVWAAVNYLVTVGSCQIDLIKKHARWMLAADPEAGLEMFVQIKPALPPSTVLPILQAEVPALCAPYLETAINNNTATHEEFDNELAHIYLQLALAREASGGAESGTRGETPSGATPLPLSCDPYVRLKELVGESSFIDADRLLLVLPSQSLLELRGLLLGKLGRHQETLRLYVHQLKSPALAEAYCDKVYDTQRRVGQQGRPMWSNRSDPGDYDIYLTLIQVYLERNDNGDSNYKGRQPDSRNWDAVARLLSRKHDRVDPRHALDLLPDEVSLQTVLPFLQGAVKATGEQNRNFAVVKNLNRSENLQVREDLIRAKQRSILINFERACQICNKRVGNAAFVAYPDGSLAHYSCYRRDLTTASRSTGAKSVFPLMEIPIGAS